MNETMIVALALIFSMVFFVLGLAIGFRQGRHFGQRLEMDEMISLMEALKIDCYEQTAFRDRFVKALRWARDNGVPGTRTLGRD